MPNADEAKLTRMRANRMKTMNRISRNFTLKSKPFYRFYGVMLCTAWTMLSQDVCPLVCPSIRLLHAGIVSKRLNVLSNFFHRRIATPPQFSLTNVFAIFQRGPQQGRRMQGVRKNRDFRPISRFRSEITQNRAIVTIEH